MLVQSPSRLCEANDCLQLSLGLEHIACGSVRNRQPANQNFHTSTTLCFRHEAALGQGPQFALQCGSPLELSDKLIWDAKTIGSANQVGVNDAVHARHLLYKANPSGFWLVCGIWFAQIVHRNRRVPSWPSYASLHLA